MAHCAFLLLIAAMARYCRASWRPVPGVPSMGMLEPGVVNQAGEPEGCIAEPTLRPKPPLDLWPFGCGGAVKVWCGKGAKAVCSTTVVTG